MKKNFHAGFDIDVPSNVIDTIRETGIFPPIYNEVRRGSKSKIRIWQLHLEEMDNGLVKFYATYGDEGGKMTASKPTIIKEGKNIGKKNETSVIEQATNQAISEFEKHARVGYLKKSDIGQTKFFPMLALDYKEERNRKRIGFPAAVQPKLDGIRCIATYNGQEVEMYSRKMEKIAGLTQIRAELTKYFGRIAAANPQNALILDGEVYSDALSLQKIMAIFSRKVNFLPEDEKRLKYNIFDCCLVNNLQYSFRKRCEFITKSIGNRRYSRLILVPTREVADEEEMNEAMDQFVGEGYEGIMLRNWDGPYAPSKGTTGRSPDLQKFKPRDEEEYEIIDIEKIPSEEDGIVFVVRIETGDQLRVNGKGSRDYQMAVLKEKEKYIGYRVRVMFNGRTDDGVPKFAVPATYKIGKSAGEYIII